MSRFEVSRHLSLLLAYLIAYYSLLMEWPQPALALRDAIRAHVNGAGVGDTEYGKNMNELAATLNVAAAPAETDNFCGTRRWAHKIDPREAGALGTKIEDVQAAHTKLGEMWKVARIAFYNKAKKPALNAARTAEQRSASNEARTTDQISASNAKTNPARPAAADLTPEKRARKQKSNAAAYEKQKKSEKEQAAARRKSKHEAYHTRVRAVLQANKAAQPLGDVDAATGACACPKNIFCAIEQKRPPGLVWHGGGEANSDRPRRTAPERGVTPCRHSNPRATLLSCLLRRVHPPCIAARPPVHAPVAARLGDRQRQARGGGGGELRP